MSVIDEILAALTPEQRKMLDGQERRVREVRRRIGAPGAQPLCAECGDDGRIVFGNSVWPCTRCR